MPEPVKFDTAPLPGITSPDVKPVTVSEKVTVIGIGDVFVGSVNVDEIVAVGGVVSLLTNEMPDALRYL